MRLVITEKSSVTKILRPILPDYEYLSLTGHIYGVEYPWNIRKLPWSRIAPQKLLDSPLVLEGLDNIGYKNLKKTLKKSWDQVILALDPDIQGYTIAADVASMIRCNIVTEVCLEDTSPSTVKQLLTREFPFPIGGSRDRSRGESTFWLDRF